MSKIRCKKEQLQDILKIESISDYDYYKTLNESYKIFNQIEKYDFFFKEDYEESLKLYSDTIDKILDSINNNLINNKTFEYYILKLSLINDTIHYYDNIFKNIDHSKKISINIDVNINTSLFFNYEMIYKYMLFAFKSKKRIKDSYKNSLPSKIEEAAIKINELMKNINIIYLKLHNKEFFKYQQDTVDLAANIRNMAKDDIGINALCGYLYKGIYESSCDGGNCKIYTKFASIDKGIIDIIKMYRNFNEHEMRNNPKKINVVLDYNMSVIGKYIPDKESDYLKIQLDIYNKIIDLLEPIYKTLNSKSEE